MVVFIANIPKHVNELDMPLVENLSLILATINMTNLQTYNLGQRVGGKFIKFSKIGFEKTSKLGFRWTAGYSPSNPSISGIFF